jgi:hypothetical protein
MKKCTNMFLAPKFLILDISEGHFCPNLLIMCTLPGENLLNMEIILNFFQKKPKLDTFGGIDHILCSIFKTVNCNETQAGEKSPEYGIM